jgi:hypothetical protein
MTVDDQLCEIAMEAADTQRQIISRLERDILQLATEIEKKKANRMMAADAAQRALNFPVKAGVDYLCPVCWVERETRCVLRFGTATRHESVAFCERCGPFQLSIGV